MIQTITILPSQIRTRFDEMLLDPLYGLWKRFEDKIKPLRRKIRFQDVGKRRDFDKLTREFEDLYERKKIEEEEYKAKIKNAKKRPDIPVTGSTARFTRFQPAK
jgi:hypothetical protein